MQNVFTLWTNVFHTFMQIIGDYILDYISSNVSNSQLQCESLSLIKDVVHATTSWTKHRLDHYHLINRYSTSSFKRKRSEFRQYLQTLMSMTFISIRWFERFHYCIVSSSIVTFVKWKIIFNSMQHKGHWRHSLIRLLKLLAYKMFHVCILFPWRTLFRDLNSRTTE